MDRKQVYDEAVKLLGKVPGFIELVPEDLLGPRWEEWRKLQMEETELPPKVKQLIMLAVSTYAKCPYCIDFHTEAAKLFGATEAEIVETACLTGNTALWSNFLNGIRYPKEKFAEELDGACEHVRRGQAASKAGDKPIEKKPVPVGAK